MEGAKCAVPVQEILDITRWKLAWAFQNGITGMDLITGIPRQQKGDRRKGCQQHHLPSRRHLPTVASHVPGSKFQAPGS